MNKYHNEEGKVAVLYSPGFGAGWWTWNTEYEEMIYDPSIVSILLSEGTSKEDKLKEISLHCALKYPDAYLGGMNDLTIAWLTPGTLFQIEEYDGSESLSFADRQVWNVA